MDERKNGLPLASIITGGVGTFFMIGSSPSDDGIIGFASMLICISLITAIISLFMQQYKKVCAVVAIVLCIISFMTFTGLINEQAEIEKEKAEINSRTFVITFDTDGGQSIEPMVVNANTYLSPVIPYKEGYKFEAWTLNGMVFDFQGYVNSRITSDITLKANYTKVETSTPSSSSSSTTSVSRPSTTKPSTNTYTPSTTSRYEQIYNEYAQKLRAAGPTSSINEMAEIANEGVGKMAQYMYSAKGIEGQYATYEKWATKLYDVYMNECR